MSLFLTCLLPSVRRLGDRTADSNADTEDRAAPQYSLSSFVRMPRRINPNWAKNTNNHCNCWLIPRIRTQICAREDRRSTSVQDPPPSCWTFQPTCNKERDGWFRSAGAGKKTGIGIHWCINVKAWAVKSCSEYEVWMQSSTAVDGSHGQMNTLWSSQRQECDCELHLRKLTPIRLDEYETKPTILLVIPIVSFIHFLPHSNSIICFLSSVLACFSIDIWKNSAIL